ncbi:MAG: hypothetical protein KKA90_03395 [Nanoarchaeota archaeon]|nr:hypothetical protein [Nanoarchaeota archaeon]
MTTEKRFCDYDERRVAQFFGEFLARLSKKGLVERRREGNHVFYKLTLPGGRKETTCRN